MVYFKCLHLIINIIICKQFPKSKFKILSSNRPFIYSVFDYGRFGKAKFSGPNMSVNYSNIVISLILPQVVFFLTLCFSSLNNKMNASWNVATGMVISGMWFLWDPRGLTQHIALYTGAPTLQRKLPCFYTKCWLSFLLKVFALQVSKPDHASLN